jgi:hypothetical protein
MDPRKVRPRLCWCGSSSAPLTVGVVANARTDPAVMRAEGPSWRGRCVPCHRSNDGSTTTTCTIRAADVRQLVERRPRRFLSMPRASSFNLPMLRRKEPRPSSHGLNERGFSSTCAPPMRMRWVPDSHQSLCTCKYPDYCPMQMMGHPNQFPPRRGSRQCPHA